MDQEAHRVILGECAFTRYKYKQVQMLELVDLPDTNVAPQGVRSIPALGTILQ